MGAVRQSPARRGREGWPSVKALTVRQPYAQAIAAGQKLVENRTRATSYRGPLAIHAGLAWHLDGLEDGRVLDAVGCPLRAWHYDQWPRGVVVAIAQLVDCHRADGCCKPWGDPEAYHWVLADVRVLADPVPAKGRLGLWEIDLGVSEVQR